MCVSVSSVLDNDGSTTDSGGGLTVMLVSDVLTLQVKV